MNIKEIKEATLRNVKDEQDTTIYRLVWKVEEAFRKTLKQFNLENEFSVRAKENKYIYLYPKNNYQFDVVGFELKKKVVNKTKNPYHYGREIYSYGVKDFELWDDENEDLIELLNKTLDTIERRNNTKIQNYETIKKFIEENNIQSEFALEQMIKDYTSVKWSKEH